MNPLDHELRKNYAEQFGALFDCLVGDAAAFGAIISRPHRPREAGDAWNKFVESAQRIHQHVAENELFGFPLPEVENVYRPLLTAALDFAAAVAAVNRILDAPEHGAWGESPALSSASGKVNCMGDVLYRIVTDAFGVAEELSA
jgi:hypothetical protein